MADDGSAQSQTIWPLPSFSFQVSWGSQSKIPFQEVSGLDTETQIIEYRHSNSPAYSTIKMPGIKKFGNVTMKKGIFVKDNKFWDWYSQITMNTIARVSVVVQLLDEKSNPTMTWTLTNAWPTKISSPTLKSDGNEVAIQSIEIAHEGLVIANK
jgi:phage tail-like protein